MKKKTMFTVFVVFLLFFSLINQVVSINALAQEEPIPEKPKGFLQLLGKIASKFFMIIRLFVLAAAANPQVIEIGYNETVTFEIGMINLDTNDFEVFSGIQLEKQRYLTFDVLEYPSGNEYGKWHIVFDPPIVNVVNGTKVKTNVSVTLRSNRLAEKPIQNGILKIRINDIYVFGNIFRPPKGFPGWDVPIMRSFWTFLALFVGWGRFYSGKVVTETFDVDILVKVKPVHQVNFYSVPYMVFKPDEIVSIPITLQNLGNYNDTYGFRVLSENNDIKCAEPTSITLAPGEVRDSYLGLVIPPLIFDYGTIHNIKIQVYSLDQKNITIAERTIVLESKGVYFSEISSFGIIFFIFIVILIVLFFYFKHKRTLDDICIKPDKPWKIPEEKEYLNQLKQQDKQNYNEVLSAMKDEYESALLWYKDYIKSVTKPKPIKTEIPKKKEKALTKKEEKPVKKKKKSGKIIAGLKNFLIKKKVKTVKKTKDETTEVKEKTETLFDLEVQDEKLKKERILKRIKNEQEKQKRKFDKLRI